MIPVPVCASAQRVQYRIGYRPPGKINTTIYIAWEKKKHTPGKIHTSPWFMNFPLFIVLNHLISKSDCHDCVTWFLIVWCSDNVSLLCTGHLCAPDVHVPNNITPLLFRLLLVRSVNLGLRGPCRAANSLNSHSIGKRKLGWIIGNQSLTRFWSELGWHWHGASYPSCGGWKPNRLEENLGEN